MAEGESLEARRVLVGGAVFPHPGKQLGLDLCSAHDAAPRRPTSASQAVWIALRPIVSGWV